MDAGEWSEVVLDLLESTGDKRTAATWRACVEVARTLEQYRPIMFRGPDEWDDSRQAWVSGLLRQQHDIEQIRGLAQSAPTEFGRYRVAVLDHEASEAARLGVLLWVMDTLKRIADGGVDVPAKLTRGIGDVLEHEWRVRSIPFGGDLRGHATRHTRRYDILPRAWRYA